ncbi:MAG: radical SAM protein [Acidobacteriota bacterium]
MRPLSLFRHFRALRSTPARAVAHRAATLLPDYLWGDGSSRALVNVTLEVTYRCNIECEFCFLKDSVLNERRDEMTVAEIARLADQAREYGASFFITGGEPFLRRDLHEIVAAIHARGLKVGVNTNGLLVDKAATARILDAGLDYAIFSLHGPPDVHDCLERRPGAFAIVLENLRRFAARKGRTRVLANCVIARESSARISELPALLEGIAIDGLTFQHETFLTAEEVASHRVVWETLFPGRSLPMVYQSSGYERRDMAALEDQVSRIESQPPGAFPILWKPELPPDRLSDWYGGDMKVKGRCLYIWTDTRVEPDGRVNACQVMPAIMGNVRDTPLREILNNQAYRDFRAQNRAAGGVFPACARCCKLYRNPVNFTAREPAWQTWQSPVPSPSS